MDLLTSAWRGGVQDGEVVFRTLGDQRKLRNLRRDPRIALTIQSERVNDWGLRESLVLDGTARVIEGGARAGHILSSDAAARLSPRLAAFFSR